MPVGRARQIRAEAAPVNTIRRQIVSASLRLAALTMVVKVGSAGKDVLVARTFGTGDEMDAFLIAIAVPTYLITVIGGSFSSTLLPMYVQASEQRGAHAASQLLGSALSGAFCTVIAMAAILAVIGDLLLSLLGANFEPAKLLLAKQLFYILLGTFGISSLSMLLVSALNCANRFTLSGISPIFLPTTVLFALWVGKGRFGAYALAAGTVAGYLLEFAVLLWATARHGLLHVRHLLPHKRDLYTLACHASPLLLGSAIFGCSGMIDQAMASTLGPGAVSSLGYGNKIVSLVVTVAVASLTTTIFPAFSRMVSLSQWSQIRATLRSFLLLIAVTTVPLTVALALGNEWLVRILFERGKFTAETTELVASVQLGYLLQIPFYTLGIVGVRLLMAMGRNATVLKIAVVNLMANICGNLILMQHLGATGIAVSTSLVYVGASIMALSAVHRRLKQLESQTRIPKPHFIEAL